LFNAHSAFFPVTSWREKVNFEWDDDEVHFVLLYILCIPNRIVVVMVSVLTSSAVDRGFKPWSGQPMIKIDINVLLLGWACIIKEKEQRRVDSEQRIICPSKPTCISTDYCFSELTLYKSNKACWSSTKWLLRYTYVSWWVIE
jgi:hypothetical protein